jgi:hypothetical protein
MAATRSPRTRMSRSKSCQCHIIYANSNGVLIIQAEVFLKGKVNTLKAVDNEKGEGPEGGQSMQCVSDRGDRGLLEG